MKDFLSRFASIIKYDLTNIVDTLIRANLLFINLNYLNFEFINIFIKLK